jgi:hypothetical protein
LIQVKNGLDLSISVLDERYLFFFLAVYDRSRISDSSIRAQIQIGELQKENMFLKEKIRSLELEIEIKLGLLFQVIIRIIIMQLDI